MADALPKDAHGPLHEVVWEYKLARDAYNALAWIQDLRAGLSGKRWHAYVDEGT